MNASPIAGRLFGRKNGGESCAVSVTDYTVIAEIAGERVEFDLSSSRFAFGGTNDEMLLVEATVAALALSLYIPRDAGLALLNANGGGQARRIAESLATEVARVRRRSRVTAVVVLAVLAAIGFAGYVGSGLVLRWALDRVPPKWEVSLGKALVGQLAPEADRLDDPALHAAIDPIVERLLAEVGETSYVFEVHIVKNEVVNAFALPGGQVAIFTGLIEKCETPEQLAGVLAHEFQHVLRRHSLHKIGEALKWHLLLSMVIGDLSSVHDIVIGHAANLFTLSNDREAETEADLLGFDLLVKSAIAPEGMARFFEILGQESSSMPDALSFLSTHPGSSERVTSIRERIVAMPPTDVVEIAVDWESAREKAREVKEK